MTHILWAARMGLAVAALYWDAGRNAARLARVSHPHRRRMV